MVEVEDDDNEDEELPRVSNSNIAISNNDK
jgi:hypothetical protein